MRRHSVLALLALCFTSSPTSAQTLSAGIISTLTNSVQAVAGPTIVPNNPGCSGVDQTKSTCNQCLSHCATAIAVCALTCGQSILACPACIESWAPYNNCSACVPDCLNWGESDAQICVDCDSPDLQPIMCLGTFGQLGFCVAKGQASYADNGGFGCSGATPDCDVAAGAATQCPTSSFTGMVNETSNSIDTGQALNATAPKPAPKPAPPPRPRPATATVKGWAYRGCWSDNVNARTLIGRAWKGTLTPERCAEVCKGYRYFGLEFSTECYCGNTVAKESKLFPDIYCTWSCMGNVQQVCGGRNTLSLYEVDDVDTAVLEQERR